MKMLRPIWIKTRRGDRVWGVRGRGGWTWSSNRRERPALRGMFHVNFTDTAYLDDPAGRFMGPRVRAATVVVGRAK